MFYSSPTVSCPTTSGTINFRLRLALLLIVAVFASISTADQLDDKVLRPFEEHSPPSNEIVVEKLESLPDPEIFYQKYVLPGRPVVFSGAAKALPAFNLWTDEYLKTKFGGMDVTVESGKKENRNLLRNTMSLNHFLNQYTSELSDSYMVQDVNIEMKEDLRMLRPMQCGGYTYETAIVWFSSGGTSSVLHTDDMENINCMLDGHKDIVFIDKKYSDVINKEGWNADGSFHSMDVDRFNSTAFPQIAKLPWISTRLNKGDCLYIPYRWYHIVRSSNTRNMASNLWFLPLKNFNSSLCGPPKWSEEKSTFTYIDRKEYKITDYAPLTEWKYEQGDAMSSYLKDQLFKICKNRDDIKKPELISYWKNLLDQDNKHNSLPDMLYSAFDEDSDGLLTWSEIQQFDLFDFCDQHGISFNPEDMSVNIDGYNKEGDEIDEEVGNGNGKADGYRYEERGEYNGDLGEDNEEYHENLPDSETMIDERNSYTDDSFNSKQDSGSCQSAEGEEREGYKKQREEL